MKEHLAWSWDWAFALVVVLIVAGLASRGAVITVTTADSHSRIEAAQPGDEVVIAPGTYAYRFSGHQGLPLP